MLNVHYTIYTNTHRYITSTSVYGVHKLYRHFKLNHRTVLTVFSMVYILTRHFNCKLI